MDTSKMQRNNLLPFSIIELAASGDVDAINAVLKHYEGYIIALSTVKLYNEYGKARYFVDDEIRRTLETKLITKILQFDTSLVA